jgi:hypothetical protein
MFPELEQLCALVKLDPKDVRERLHRMQKTNGLVARAGRYFYVTPTPIAMVALVQIFLSVGVLPATVFQIRPRARHSRVQAQLDL